MNEYINVLKKYAVFSGRAARKEFWMFSLVNLLVSIVIQIVASMIFGKESISATVIYVLYSLAVLVPSIAVTVRRLHDIDRSGWWFFFIFVPIVGAITLLVFHVLDSTPGDNRFGPNPKGVQAPTATPPVAPTAGTVA